MIVFFKQFYRTKQRRGGGQWVPRRDPIVLDGELVYHAENWHCSRPIGESLRSIMRTNIAGVVPSYQGVTYRPDEIHDIRIVDPEAEKVIGEYDAEIARIQRERTNYINDNYRSWRVPTKADCSRVLEGKSKEQAAKEAKELNETKPISANELGGERETAQILTNLLNKGG